MEVLQWTLSLSWLVHYESYWILNIKAAPLLWMFIEGLSLFYDSYNMTHHFSVDENNYDFIVFTDPQYGKADKELEDGTDGLRFVYDFWLTIEIPPLSLDNKLSIGSFKIKLLFSWDTDIEHVTTMCDQLNENLDNLAFIMCTGDLGSFSTCHFVTTFFVVNATNLKT